MYYLGICKKKKKNRIQKLNGKVFQYDVWSPLVAIQVWQQCFVLLMMVSINSVGSNAHYSCKAVASLCRVFGGRGGVATCLPRASEVCSMGFRSGDGASHSIQTVVSSTRHTLCGLTLLSSMRNVLCIAPAYGCIYVCRISSVYVYAVRLPCSRTQISVWPPKEMPAKYTHYLYHNDLFHRCDWDDSRFQALSR